MTMLAISAGPNRTIGRTVSVITTISVILEMLRIIERKGRLTSTNIAPRKALRVPDSIVAATAYAYSISTQIRTSMISQSGAIAASRLVVLPKKYRFQIRIAIRGMVKRKMPHERLMAVRKTSTASRNSGVET